MISDATLFKIMPAPEWKAIEAAALMEDRGFPVLAESFRRRAGYDNLPESKRY